MGLMSTITIGLILKASCWITLYAQFITIWMIRMSGIPGKDSFLVMLNPLLSFV